MMPLSTVTDSVNQQVWDYQASTHFYPCLEDLSYWVGPWWRSDSFLWLCFQSQSITVLITTWEAWECNPQLTRPSGSWATKAHQHSTEESLFLYLGHANIVWISVKFTEESFFTKMLANGPGLSMHLATELHPQPQRFKPCHRNTS